MKRENAGDVPSDAESTFSRRRFLAASAAGIGATTVGWNVVVSGTASRRRNASASPFAANASERWTGLLEDEETEPEDARELTQGHHTLLEGTAYETTLHVVDAPREGPTGFVVGGMHGDERSGHRAAEAVASWGVERGRLVVLPAANRPALERGTREGPNGDLNRKFPSNEHQAPTTELARAIWDAVVAADPDWLADLHSSAGVYRGGDGRVGQAIFPSPVPPAERYAATAVRAVNARFDLQGSTAYDRGGTLDGDRPMLAHRAGELLDIPTFIMETTETLDLRRQVDFHTVAVDALLHSFHHWLKL